MAKAADIVGDLRKSAARYGVVANKAGFATLRKSHGRTYAEAGVRKATSALLIEAEIDAAYRVSEVQAAIKAEMAADYSSAPTEKAEAKLRKLLKEYGSAVRSLRMLQVNILALDMVIAGKRRRLKSGGSNA